MTRMLTKKMRGSYECSGTLGKMQLKDWFDLVLNEKKKRQRLLTLKRIVK